MSTRPLRSFTALCSSGSGAKLLLAVLLPATCQAQFEYRINNGSISITKYTGSGGPVAVPRTIDGLPVTSIGTSAFAACTNPITVSLPDTMLTIEPGAFSASALVAISLPAGLTNVGEGAFSSCANLTNINIPAGVSNIQSETFAYCGLTSLRIPDHVTSIGEAAFSGCDRLSELSLGSQLRTLGDWSFRRTAVKTASISAGVTNIGAGVFLGCTNLTRIEVDPRNTSYSSLEGVVFDKSMATLVVYPAGKGPGYQIPENVTDIADAAFGGSATLTNLAVGVSRLP